jgi:hypothetical protein
MQMPTYLLLPRFNDVRPVTLLRAAGRLPSMLKKPRSRAVTLVPAQLTPVQAEEQGSVLVVQPLRDGQDATVTASFTAIRPDVCAHVSPSNVPVVDTMELVHGEGSGPHISALLVAMRRAKDDMPLGHALGIVPVREL